MASDGSDSIPMEVEVSAPVPLFTKSEKVLCMQGVRIYEATVLDVEHISESVGVQKGGEFVYFVHYKGWAKRCDEWVSQLLLIKWTEETFKIKADIDTATEKENKTKIKQFKAASGAAKRKQGINKGKGGEQSGSLNGPPHQSQYQLQSHGNKKYLERVIRRKRSEAVETETVYKAKQEVQIPIPHTLKKALLDDWKCVFDRDLLTIIPSEHSVDSILGNYVDYVRRDASSGSGNGDARDGRIGTAQDLCKGIQEYFNTMLQTQLLYGLHEQNQLSTFKKMYEMKNQEIPKMSSLYGPYHLLRLFTKLGVCLAYTALQPDAVDHLLENIANFLRFLENNFTVYFDSPNDDDEEENNGHGDGDDDDVGDSGAPKDLNLFPASSNPPNPGCGSAEENSRELQQILQDPEEDDEKPPVLSPPHPIANPDLSSVGGGGTAGGGGRRKLRPKSLKYNNRR